jgi:hypothetical protein
LQDTLWITLAAPFERQILQNDTAQEIARIVALKVSRQLGRGGLPFGVASGLGGRGCVVAQPQFSDRTMRRPLDARTGVSCAKGRVIHARGRVKA